MGHGTIYTVLRFTAGCSFAVQT
uniref:Uncharacterized protein n=1 Tax=Anguilla anguilla TaxID=7936 RepID=A0A0E9W0E4_ANGAN